ncbi:hypothetical protein TRFO_25097 [Tritrichomonas foetus]|uniref:Initiator binding domain-containing protein n=1 Tax=Tritrichomonas foetus TaxID=1144522 RepID=A0A1J4KAX9_9EUKA|nr:hypothetical protein TRFO_25097 [Tritrichomonas foetus]|eukprot:OHT06846.1 hypothetical protein TRFO_25097 [Tritrichomonas foetus]
MSDTPNYFEKLTKDEQSSFRILQSEITKALENTPKNTKISDNFGVVVDLLANYIKCDDRDSEIRKSLVCGFLWIEDCVAINTRQLCKTVCKCKSTINNGLQALGYSNKVVDAKLAGELTSSFPFMRSDFAAMRQWTFRCLPKLNLSQNFYLLSDNIENMINFNNSKIELNSDQNLKKENNVNAIKNYDSIRDVTGFEFSTKNEFTDLDLYDFPMLVNSSEPSFYNDTRSRTLDFHSLALLSEL